MKQCSFHLVPHLGEIVTMCARIVSWFFKNFVEHFMITIAGLILP